MLPINKHIDLLRLVCERHVSTLHMELDELVDEAWIKTHEMTEPALIVFSTQNLMKDLHRKQRRFSVLLKRYADIKRHESKDEPEENLVEHSLNELMASANLTEAERNLLYERYYQYKTTRQIAVAQDVSFSTVANNLRKVEKKLYEVGRSSETPS